MCRSSDDRYGGGYDRSIDVVVVGDEVRRHRRVFIGGVGIIDRHRRVVDAGDGDRHRGRVGPTVAVRSDVVEGV